jgi:hypothetical protein
MSKTADVYVFKKNGEYATFMLFEQPRKDDPCTGYFALAIESSFGGFAYAWSHLGVPFKQFLCGCDEYYVGKKMCQGEQQVFDAAATEKAIRRAICEKRRHDRWSAEAAREAWEDSSIEDQHDFSVWYDSKNDWCRDAHELAEYGPGPRVRAFDALYKLFWAMLCEALSGAHLTVAVVPV